MMARHSNDQKRERFLHVIHHLLIFLGYAHLRCEREEKASILFTIEQEAQFMGRLKGAACWEIRLQVE